MNVTAAQRPAEADFAPAGLFADPLTDRLAGFIRGIGLVVEAATLDEPTLLPGVAARRGRLLVDEARLAHPGDLLHEAGHLAILEPTTRMAREGVSDDPGEEMAALAWSYAAAIFVGVDPAVVFHDGGYRGGASALLTAFAGGGYIGTPMLHAYGMTLMPMPRGGPPDAFPHMRRWLR